MFEFFAFQFTYLLIMKAHFTGYLAIHFVTECSKLDVLLGVDKI